MDDNNSSELILAFTPEDEIVFHEIDDVSNSQSTTGSPSHVSAPATSRIGLLQATLGMTNKLSDKPVLFRIQTTSPANYRVKPAHGRIEPNETQQIQVIMLSESKRNDKFLIRFTPVPQPEDTDLDFAALFEVASSAFLQQKKIPCAFPSGMFGLMAATGASASGAPISPIAPSLSQTRLNTATGPVSETASVASVSRAGTADLAAELKEAKSKIEKLTKELKLATSAGNAKIPKEWSDLFKGQYGAPPVLLLLVAIFAFLIGLLF